MNHQQSDDANANGAPEDGRFGIRVALYPDDPFRQLLDDGWEKLHWFPTAEQRDRALEDMRGRHVYSRDSDTPRLIFETVER